MSEKLDITGTWKRTKTFLGSLSGFVKKDLFLFLLPKDSCAVLVILKMSDKSENFLLTVLDTIEKGSDPNQTALPFNFGKTDYEFEYFKEREEIEIRKR